MTQRTYAGKSKRSPAFSLIDRGETDAETRARIPDAELSYYEEIIAVSLDVLQYLRLAILWARADEVDNLLNSAAGVNFIRQRTIAEMQRRKGEAASRRNGSGDDGSGDNC